jgi:hypothetical protein
MSPQAYVQAMERVRAAIVEAAVTVDVIDVGGGFPSVYPGMEPPALEAYFDAIHEAFESLPVSYSSELWCEPGRALCAEYASLLVRVERRRGDELYINDGAYGALFDAAHVGWRFPVKLLREPDSNARDLAFSFYGPTCDDMDRMAGPFMLPADIAARRLYRDRYARRLWLRDAHRLQRLHRRRDGVMDDEPMASCISPTTRSAEAFRRTSSSCKGHQHNSRHASEGWHLPSLNAKKGDPSLRWDDGLNFRRKP